MESSKGVTTNPPRGLFPFGGAILSVNPYWSYCPKESFFAKNNPDKAEPMMRRARKAADLSEQRWPSCRRIKAVRPFFLEFPENAEAKPYGINKSIREYFFSTALSR
jgi:hypothetical protein